MKFTTSLLTLQRVKADAVVAFVPQDKKLFAAEIAKHRRRFGKRIDNAVELSHFAGKTGEYLTFLTERKIASPRLILVGTGETKKHSFETYRRAAATAAKHARSLKAKHLAFAVPAAAEFPAGALTRGTCGQSILEGADLSLYRYEKYFTDKNEHKSKIAEITLCDLDAALVKELKEVLRVVRITNDAAMFARDLENAPGNELYPETLAAAATGSARQHGYRCEVWDKKKIEQMKFGGLLAVNSGSDRPPRFLILEHNAGNKNLPTVVLVGKGITFDAGGISIKPASGMAEMKMDMSGAAAVIGTVEAATRLGLPLHIVGLIPSTENLLGGSAMRPGDVVTHYGGKTSEVDNTDAEGRLVLADALAYASRYSPAAVIDLATLTGACVVALGHHATGMMGNDDGLMSELKTAGERTFERVWQLPLYEEYEPQIKSDIADVKNVGGRWGGAITAALFLKKFIGDYKWVHLDIAGTAILEENMPYAPKGGSGVGVRLLTEFLKNRISR
jgi:leucyl aminopeptidase